MPLLAMTVFYSIDAWNGKKMMHGDGVVDDHHLGLGENSIRNRFLDMTQKSHQPRCFHIFFGCEFSKDPKP